MHQGHDRAFVVAGATKAALLEDFQKAIDDSLSKGLPFEGWLDKDDTYHPGFVDRFDDIVKRHGWDYNGGRNWRARVIYETNLKSAHAAGRYKQMKDPATLKAFPYWQYVHGLERVPVAARAEHEGWDGLVLSANDPWWDTYYPPNGWKCGCGVRTISKPKLKRLGKSGPDQAPPIAYEVMQDPGTGELINYPKGVDMGWGYAPGKSWANGLVPRERADALKATSIVRPKPDLAPLSGQAKPAQAKILPEGKSDEFYVESFLDEFGASIGDSTAFRDKAGQVLTVSDKLFRNGSGTWKVKKLGREVTLAYLAEAIVDPDEIWVDWVTGPNGETLLIRRYLRYFEELMGFASFGWSAKGWEGKTAFNPTKGRQNKPDAKYLEKHRKGSLLYRRESE